MHVLVWCVLCLWGSPHGLSPPEPMDGLTVGTQRKESLLANVTREPRAYELMSILVPDMQDEDTQAAIGRISGYITQATGEVTQTLVDSPWGRRRLAYTMRFGNVDYRDGFYVLSRFNASPNAINDIERDLKLDTGVIRYLLVIDDPKAGEQANNQDAVETSNEAASAASTEGSPQGQRTASEPATSESQESAGVTPAAATPEAEPAQEAPAARQEPVETSDRFIEETTEEVAEHIEGEENPAPADAPEARAQRTTSRKLPTEGEGEAWVPGDGTQDIPEDFPIKGNASSKIFHPKESPSYDNTVAEIYFSSNEAAESYGYRLPKTLQQAGAKAAESVVDAAQNARDEADSDPREE